ncbi:MAG: hypothetical protein ACREKL_06500 [Chthoniobacterales bacterium]
MDSFDSNNPRDDEALRDSDEALWRLLGRARPVEASPYFARKVLRAIETASAPQPAWWQILLRTVAPVAVCAGIAVLALVGAGAKDNAQPVANADIEFETIQNLDLLVSNYESSIWLDPSSSSR